MASKVEKVVVIGGGPAGHAAAVYLSRARLYPVLYEGSSTEDSVPGGQLMTTTTVENYPGFDEGIDGQQLVGKLRNHAETFGTKIKSKHIKELYTDQKPFLLVTEDDEKVYSETVIICTGSYANLLDIKGGGSGEGGFWNKGISACAVCDGALYMFRDKPLAVVGGGDSAMEEAIYLTKYASKVYVIHRRDELRASVYMQEKAKSNEKIEFLYSYEVEEAQGTKFLENLIIVNKKNKKRSNLKVNGLFYAIGFTPNTGFIKGEIEKDKEGHIITVPGSTYTSVEGIFAAGDVQDKKYRQAIVAAGAGCMAALDAERYLSGTKIQ